jgi:hypothetical protein
LEVEDFTEICMKEERKLIIWWKAGVWRLKGLRRGVEIGICPICRKDKEL